MTSVERGILNETYRDIPGRLPPYLQYNGQIQNFFEHPCMRRGGVLPIETIVVACYSCTSGTTRDEAISSQG